MQDFTYFWWGRGEGPQWGLYSSPMRPRVAYFPDSFHEVNGVAHTSRNFVAYAQRHDLPFLCVRAGTRDTAVEQHGNLRTLELPRSSAAVGMEKDLAFDPLFWRHVDAIGDELHRFQPDILHMTGPQRTRHLRRVLRLEAQHPARRIVAYKCA